jgi:hypothetical protein
MRFTLRLGEERTAGTNRAMGMSAGLSISTAQKKTARTVELFVPGGQ